MILPYYKIALIHISRFRVYHLNCGLLVAPSFDRLGSHPDCVNMCEQKAAAHLPLTWSDSVNKGAMFRLHFQMLASCFPFHLDKEVTGSIWRDCSGETSNQNVMISATKWRFHPGQRSISKMALSEPPGEPNVLFSPWQSTHKCH